MHSRYSEFKSIVLVNKIKEQQSFMIIFLIQHRRGHFIKEEKGTNTPEETPGGGGLTSALTNVAHTQGTRPLQDDLSVQNHKLLSFSTYWYSTAEPGLVPSNTYIPMLSNLSGNKKN